jgi:lactoylglutathione lyase
MRIAHVAIWTADLERLVAFYTRYFGAGAGHKYINPRRGFESYFLTFDDGARLELMRIPALGERYVAGDGVEVAGLAHLALSAGSESAVDALTEQLRRDGHRIVGEPRRTGDGYYESSALDPDGNRVEITT